MCSFFPCPEICRALSTEVSFPITVLCIPIVLCFFLSEGHLCGVSSGDGVLIPVLDFSLCDPVSIGTASEHVTSSYRVGLFPVTGIRDLPGRLGECFGYSGIRMSSVIFFSSLSVSVMVFLRLTVRFEVLYPVSVLIFSV